MAGEQQHVTPDQCDARQQRVFDKLDKISEEINSYHTDTVGRLASIEAKQQSASGVVGHIITLAVAILGMLGLKFGVK